MTPLNWSKLELIANHHDVYCDEYEGDLLPVIERNRIAAVNLPPVFMDDSGVFSTDIPIYLNLDIPTSKQLPTAKIALIRHYKEIFKTLTGINFTNNVANIYDLNLPECLAEAAAIVDVCKELGLKSRYCLRSAIFFDYDAIQPLFGIVEESGVDELIYMHNSKICSTESCLLEAIEISNNISVPVSFAGRLPSMVVLNKTPQINRFILPPGHIRELIAETTGHVN